MVLLVGVGRTNVGSTKGLADEAPERSAHLRFVDALSAMVESVDGDIERGGRKRVLGRDGVVRQEMGCITVPKLDWLEP